jgi:hypothetical protein
MGYGIYTVGDHNFFAGIAASINALRLYGCEAPVAVMDIGFTPWMRRYLRDFHNVHVLDMEPLRGLFRFTDVKSNEDPLIHGWAFKAFGIVHFNCFDEFTFIDGDFLPLCNIEAEVRPLIRTGAVVCTEDGSNNWDERHREAVGVAPGRYMNINAGFFSLDMKRYGWLMHEWRNLMTRRKPFDLWYGDQGAFNALLDKYDVKKVLLDRVLWNQTWLNAQMAAANEVDRVAGVLTHTPTRRRIYAWHGTGWYKLWHQIGIDHYRSDVDERERFYQEAQGKSPSAVVALFRELLFLDRFNRRLVQTGFELS